MLHAIIMAGGAGTRFWPESRRLRPKQLLPLVAQRSMLQLTLDRLKGLVPPERTLVVTGAALAEAVAEQLPELPPESIVGEPCKRDTAPCIGLAAMLVSQRDPDATLVVLPSDHVVRPEESFREALRAAVQLVEERPDATEQPGQAPPDQAPRLLGAAGVLTDPRTGRIVTLGIRPSYPAESFGYIQRGESYSTSAGGRLNVYRARQFREKPVAAVAREYFESGDYYWNSGIFVWKGETILSALAERQSEMHARLRRITDAWTSPSAKAVFAREYEAIRGISIDYAVMEQATDVLVIEAPFEWDDVGSWRSLARLRGADPQDNTIVGRYLGLDTSGCIVRGPDDHLIVTLGLKDCIVVHTPDATLVANKQDEEAIRKVVQLLEERGWREYL
jgi:mannose-1-phosphate guanylyltransferase